MDIKLEKDRQNSVCIDVEKIRHSRVLLIGLGGLGSPIAFALAGAGTGKLTLCDKDTVTAGNLNRQTLYSAADIGKSKALSALRTLSEFAPDIDIDCINGEVTEENSDEITNGYDLVILAVDNNRVRFAVNKSCVNRKIPLLNTGISGFFGNTYLFVPEKTPCLACILSENESGDNRTSAAACGIVGSMGATASLDFLGGRTDNIGKLAVIDCREMTTEYLPVRKKHDCDICGGADQ